ncbi:12042_t:CDS:2, partial [Acaulospora colombiana]
MFAEITQSGIKVTYSDCAGINDIPEQIGPVIDEAGDIHYFSKIHNSDHTAQYWLKRLGQSLAKHLAYAYEVNVDKGIIIFEYALFSVARFLHNSHAFLIADIDRAVLTDFPEGYLMFKHEKVYKDEEKTRHSIYKSTNAFMPHLFWLASDKSNKCKCRFCACNKMEEEPLLTVSPRTKNIGGARSKNGAKRKNKVKGIIDFGKLEFMNFERKQQGITTIYRCGEIVWVDIKKMGDEKLTLLAGKSLEEIDITYWPGIILNRLRTRTRLSNESDDSTSKVSDNNSMTIDGSSMDCEIIDEVGMSDASFLFSSASKIDERIMPTSDDNSAYNDCYVLIPTINCSQHSYPINDSSSLNEDEFLVPDSFSTSNVSVTRKCDVRCHKVVYQVELLRMSEKLELDREMLSPWLAHRPDVPEGMESDCDTDKEDDESLARKYNGAIREAKLFSQSYTTLNAYQEDVTDYNEVVEMLKPNERKRLKDKVIHFEAILFGNELFCIDDIIRLTPCDTENPTYEDYPDPQYIYLKDIRETDNGIQLVGDGLVRRKLVNENEARFITDYEWYRINLPEEEYTIDLGEVADSTLEWVDWMDSLIIEDIFQKENITFYPYNDFNDLKVVGSGSGGNVCKATMRNLRKNVVLKPISLSREYSHKDLIYEIKRYRQLEVHGNILKLEKMIVKKEILELQQLYENFLDQNSYTYLVVFEYSDGGSLRQFLKENSETISWHTKLQLSKQLAGALMCLHSNGIVHGSLNSSKVLVHKGKIKLNPFGIVRRVNESKKLIEKLIGPIQYADPQYLEILKSVGCKKSVDIYSLAILFWEISSSGEPYKSELRSRYSLIDDICNGRREIISDEVPREYSKICQDCWQHNENHRPNIEQVFEALDNVDTKNKRKSLNSGKNRSFESNLSKIAKYDPPFIDVSDWIDGFLKDLFEFFIEQFNKQNHPKYVAQLVRKYIDDHNKNPAKVLIMMFKQQRLYLTSLIGLFYQFGIGTLVDSQIAFEMYAQVIKSMSIRESPLDSFEINNRLISEFSIGFMYLFGTGVEQDQIKAFQVFSKLSDEGFALAKAYLGECFERGYGTNWNATKALELYSESAETGSIVGKTYLDYCYMNGIGISKDVTKGFD